MSRLKFKLRNAIVFSAAKDTSDARYYRRTLALLELDRGRSAGNRCHARCDPPERLQLENGLCTRI